MINKYDTADKYVVGMYQEVGKPVHALIRADNQYTYIGPLKTICGCISNIHYTSSRTAPMKTFNISNVTCKKCLQALEKKGITTSKAKEDEPIKVVGTCTYAMNYPIHALIERSPAISNPVARGPLLKALCGALAFSTVYRSDDVVSKITCKECLKMIKQGGIIIPKKDKTIELMGIYRYTDNFPTHALIKRESKAYENPRVGIPPLRSVCNAYPEVYRPDNSPTGNKAILRQVTCEHCLDKLKQLGLSPQPAKKKFFLVFYDGGTVDSIYDFEELLQDVHRFKPTINKILLIESYRELSVEDITIVTDKYGNEITKEDL